MILIEHFIFQRDKAILRRFVTTNCSTTSREYYNLHEFLQDEALHAKWVQAVKHY